MYSDADFEQDSIDEEVASTVKSARSEKSIKSDTTVKSKSPEKEAETKSERSKTPQSMVKSEESERRTPESRVKTPENRAKTPKTSEMPTSDVVEDKEVENEVSDNTPAIDRLLGSGYTLYRQLF